MRGPSVRRDLARHLALSLSLLLPALAAPAAARAPSACSPSAWTAASPLPGTAVRYGFAQHGGDFYVIAPGALRRYDSVADLWTTLAPMPRALQIPGVAYHDGKLYAAGGHDDGLTNELFIYDVATNAWTEGASMPIWSYGSAAGVFGGKLFVVSGTSGQYLEVYDIASNTWSVGPSPPVSYRLGGHTQVGQYLYLIGGLASGGNTASRRLDMASLTWSTGPAWTPGRGDFALASDGTRLYAMGGRVWNESVPSAEVYELLLASWPGGTWTRRAPDLPSPREANQAGFSLNGRIWSTGGYGAGATHTLEHLYLDVDPPDVDGDGVGDACDCDAGNPAVWSTPGEVRNLILSKSSTPSHSVLQWDVVEASGGAAVAYDTLRSDLAGDFVSDGVCVESNDGADVISSDASAPLPGAAYFYLVRARNACPGSSGSGSPGTASDGTTRTARSCP